MYKALGYLSVTEQVLLRQSIPKGKSIRSEVLERVSADSPPKGYRVFSWVLKGLLSGGL